MICRLQRQLCDQYATTTSCQTIPLLLFVVSVINVAEFCFFRCHSLNNGGHIYYVSVTDSLGIVALIDASECPPTFGAGMYINVILPIVSVTFDYLLSNLFFYFGL